MCACVFGIYALNFLLLRDDLERSKYCLDPWLSCMFDCIHIYVFLFLKNCFKANSTAPRHLLIPGLSIELCSCFLSQSRTLSIVRWIDRESFCPLDSSSTATSIHWACFAMETFGHLLDSWICRSLLILETFRHLLSIKNYWTPIYRVSAIWSSFSLISLDLSMSFHLPNLSHSLQTSSSRCFRPRSSYSSLGKGPKSFIFMHFIFF